MSTTRQRTAVQQEDHDSTQTPTRREFLRGFSTGLLAIGGIGLAAGLGSCSKDNGSVEGPTLSSQPVTLTLANEPSLQTVGGFVRRSFTNKNGGREVIVVRVAVSGAAAFKTMSVVCTHAGCNVGNPSGGQVTCPCHGSVYSSESSNFAANLSGPAPSPLRTFPTTFDGTTITIDF